MKRAFTLPEVILTLVIIGVVAILTIPSLLNNMRQKGFEAAYKKALNTLANSCPKILLTDDSASMLSDICGEKFLPDCLEKVSELSYDSKTDFYLTKDGMGFKQLGIGTETPKDKTMIGKYYKILIDVNGKGQPNQLCKDRYIVYIDYSGIVTAENICNTSGEYASSNNNSGQGGSSTTNNNSGQTTIKDIGEPFSPTAVRIGDYWVDVKSSGLANLYIDCSNTSSEDYKYCRGVTTSDSLYGRQAAAIKACDQQGARLGSRADLLNLYNQSNGALSKGPYTYVMSSEGHFWNDSSGNKNYSASCQDMHNGNDKGGGGCGWDLVCIK